MNEDTTKIKNIYVPLASIGLAFMIMLIDVMFLSNKAYDSLLQGMLFIVVGKTVMYTVVMMLGLVLCDWCGHPFDMFLVSLLQLVAVTLLVVAVGTLTTLIGGVAFYLNIIIFLGLMGYFFSDDAINALIAIFVIYAGHLAVTGFLMPTIRAFFL